MKCPNCSAKIELPQERYQARMRAKGLCITCGQPADHDHYFCRKCRIKRALYERQRYLRKTRADVREQVKR